MSVQRMFKSVCTTAQSDQSLCFPHEGTADPWVPIEHLSKTLIRLRRCAGWSESSNGPHANLYLSLDTGSVSRSVKGRGIAYDNWRMPPLRDWHFHWWRSTLTKFSHYLRLKSIMSFHWCFRQEALTNEGVDVRCWAYFVLRLWTRENGLFDRHSKQGSYEPVKDTGWSVNSRTPNMAVPRIDESLIDQRVEKHLSKLTWYKRSASCQMMSANILIGTGKTMSVIVDVYRSV